MEYNDYYPGQTGHPAPNIQTNQHAGPQMQTQASQGGPPQMQMHSQMPPQNIRQAIPPGHPSHHQQIQQMPHMGHHTQQQMPSQQQQQQHPNYHHQIQPPHPHAPPVSHSNSPHAPPQQHHHHHHNHQPSMSAPLPQQQSGMTPQHVHSQSPHHHHGGPVHIQHQQSVNQMARPQMNPSILNHQQSGLQQPIHQQNFFAAGPMPPQSGLHHFPQQNHHPHHQSHHHHHQHHQPPLMHHLPPMVSYHSHIQQSIGRNSPYYPNVLQTELRIIELNRRLQSRPRSDELVSPIPSRFDDNSIWWERFACDFFDTDATLTLRTHEDKPIDYTICRTLIPRFFRTYFDGGVTDLSINLRRPRELILNPHMITLDCDQAVIVTTHMFRHPALTANQGIVVHTEGHLTLDFVSNSFDILSIKSWRFDTRASREFIDKALLVNIGIPNNYPTEQTTRHGLTKSTISYLKMCMIMEPMQELMFQHRQSNMDPRSCLRKFLFDRYKYRSGDDGRATTNKRRKRKPSAAPPVAGQTQTNKKSKATANNSIGIGGAPNSNMMMSPLSAAPNFSLASQDVMVVGEPSMMGGDFGDDNERMITRMENTQYDPTASISSILEESDSMNASKSTDNGIDNNMSNEMSVENQALSPSLLQQRQQQQFLQQQQQPIKQISSPLQQQQSLTHQQPLSQSSTQINGQLDQSSSPQNNEVARSFMQQQQLKLEPPDIDQDSSNPTSQQTSLGSQGLDRLQEHHQSQPPQQAQQSPVGTAAVKPELSTQRNDCNLMSSQLPMDPRDTQSQNEDEGLTSDSERQQPSSINDTKVSSVVDQSNESSLMMSVNSVEQLENHTNSIQNVNDGSNSNSQLPCSTSTTANAIEQQQPVDNGVA